MVQVNPGMLTTVRTLATAVATGLAAFGSTHPQDTWIAGVIAALAILGIHAIPSIGQQQTPPTPDQFARAIVSAVNIIENGPKGQEASPK